jgi:hypothetical protein
MFLLALLGVVLALPAAAQVNDTYVIPAAANTIGAFNTRWLTQISIFNPQVDYELRVSAVFIPTGGAQGIEVAIDIPPNAVFLTDDVLGEVFEVGGTGSLLIATFPEDNPGVPDDVISRSFLVISQTYNNSSTGTYGQTVPGVWTGLQDDGITSIAHGIRNITSEGWRTNVGAVNLGRRNVTMRVTVYDYDGNRILRDAPFNIPPMGHLQSLLPVQVDRGSIEFYIEDPSGEAVVFPYTSTIDQLSGDAVYQTPVLLASAGSLYGKKGFDPTQIGTKINTTHARQVRSTAKSIGSVKLVREGGKYYVVK